MGALLSIPVLLASLILQIAVFSQLNLVQGNLDLVLLIIAAWAVQERVKAVWVWALFGGFLVGYVSAIPFLVPVISYLVAIFFARYLHGRIWQVPIMAMLLTVLIGTIVYHAASILSLQIFAGLPFTFSDGLRLVSFPSILLNLFLAVPVYAMMRDIAASIYPE